MSKANVTTHGFEIGKRYKTRDGFVTAELIATGPTRLVFGDIADSDELYVRNLKGCYNNVTESRDDFLPIEVHEPRKVEGIVWVNEYENKTRCLGSLEVLFGHELAIMGNKKECETLTIPDATRVAVKYKVTFEEIEK